MKTSIISLATMASLAYCQNYSYGSHFGNALSTGPTADNTFIRESITTLVLPAFNSPQTNDLCLWPGMGTELADGSSDLVQALALSDAQYGAGCGMNTGAWCVVASTLEDGVQEYGTFVNVTIGTHLTIQYKYNDATTQYDQTVSVGGRVISKLSTTSGKARGWGTAEECQFGPCGTVPAHTYLNTQIIMDVADPTYNETLGTTGASGKMVTKDGGKTWTIATININAFTYTS